MSDTAIPTGYEAFPADGSFSDVLQPFYMHFRDDDAALFGVKIEKRHLNPMAICHGGVYMTLMDFCLSANLCHNLKKFVGTPTINLNMDFLSAATEGDFIWGDIETLRITHTMGFVQGIVRNQKGEALARANATFKLPKDISQAPGISLDDLKAMRADNTQPETSVIK